MVPTSGRNEQFRCIITYGVAGEASRVHQHLRCQGENRNFDAVTRMSIEDDKVTGDWADNVYSISGTLSGKVTAKGFNIQLTSFFFERPDVGRLVRLPADPKVVPNDRSVA